MNDYLLSLLTAHWLIHPRAKLALQAMIASAIRAGNAAMPSLTDDMPKAYAVALNGRQFSFDDKLPENSVAVIPVRGTLYSWYTTHIEDMIAEANSNASITAILFYINSPGGMTHRIDTLANAIKKSAKPADAYTSGMCASAAQWIASACGTVTAASPMDTFGSVGVMTSFLDDTKFWEDIGIKWEDIYATKSTLKNHEYREAMKGNMQPIIENLDFINELFHSAISDNLGIERSDKNPVFKGATFNATEAIQHKLATRIGTFDEALRKVFAKATAKKANKIITN